MANRLPEHLEILLTDEPVFDLYSYGPWRIPDGLLETLRAKANDLAADPRAQQLSSQLIEFYKRPAPPVGAELNVLTQFLCGASALRGGNRGDLTYEFLDQFFSDGEKPYRNPEYWYSQSGAWRPPSMWTVESTGLDSEKRETAFALIRECLRILEAIPPFTERLTALTKLYDLREGDPAGREQDRTAPVGDLAAPWAALAEEHDLLSVLPEVAGPAGYLTWVYDGFAAVHQRLSATVTAKDTAEAVAELLLQAGLERVPVDLSVALERDQASAVEDRFAARKSGFDASRWQTDTRAWLARCLLAGEADTCRAWLDMAVRITGTAQGLPDIPAYPKPLWVPVAGFQKDLRRLFRIRKVSNPLVGKIASMPAPTPVDTDDVADAHARIEQVTSRIVGQPDLVSALDEVALHTDQPVRMLIAGPDGTGHGLAVDAVEQILAGRGLAQEPIWLSDEMLVSLTVSAAVSTLAEKVEAARGARLLVIDGLDALVGEADCGPACAEELRRFLEQSEGRLHVVALAGTGGDEKLFTANPALLRLFRVARTRDFATPEYVDLFRQAVEHQGAIARDDTAADAGDMLARNPGVRNLRNGRLVDYLATLAVAEARKRTGKDRGFVVRPEDLPATVLPGATGIGGSSAAIPADPQTELAALIGLAGLKREVELLVAEAKAEKLRRDAGLPVTGPARHMVFLGNPGTAKTTVARLLAAIYRELGLLSSGHLVEVSRADLIAEYIGQTAPKVVATVDRALGGVLFVDEAYALAQSDSSRDFGHEAIATLLKLMEDHRDDLVVIAAGYEREMKSFLAANSGLASRFPRQLHFPDYSDGELVEIFAKMATDAGFTLADGVTGRVRELVAGLPRDNRFGNGRLVRNLLERAIALQARRITSGETTPDQLAQIRPEDLPDDLDTADRGADSGTGMYL